MVLEDATAPDAPFSAPSAPSSDMDRYSGDQNPTVLSTRSPTRWPIQRPNGLPPLYIDFSSLPMPWMPFFQSTSNAQARKAMGETVQKTNDEYYKAIGRPLEQSEADAVAFHLAKAMRMSSFGGPVGVFVASIFAVSPKNMETFRFPFWLPSKEKFNPDKIFGVKGLNARIVWHGLRFGAYGIIGSVLGNIAMSSYALTVANVGRLQDPRLKDINENLKRRTERIMKERGVPREDRTEGRREGETFEMARQRTRAQSAGRRGVVDDDMSPTGGSFSQDYGEIGAGAGGDEGMLSDSQIQQLQHRERRGQQSGGQFSMSGMTDTPSRPSSQPSNPEPPASRQPASSWERIRQQAQNSPSSSQQQPARSRQATSSDDDDAFGLSNGSRNSGVNEYRQTIQRTNEENERGLQRARQDAAGGQSKYEAQRAFDAQLDREREGKFGEKDTDGRWS